MKFNSMATRFGIISVVTAVTIMLTGCGGSLPALAPNYNKREMAGVNIQRDKLVISDVIDKRSGVPNQIGIGCVGLFNKDVPYYMTVNTDEFVKGVLDNLIVRKPVGEVVTPITVFIDSFEVGERTRFIPPAEIGYFNCKLRFAYPVSVDSIVQTSISIEKTATTLSDITDSLEHLMYWGLVDCAKDFIRETVDKEKNLYTGDQRSLAKSAEIESMIYGQPTQDNKSVPSNAAKIKISAEDKFTVKEGYLPPAKDTPYILEGGLGIGLPYGALGGRGAIGIDMVMAEIGIGTYPPYWKTCYSFGASLRLFDRYSWIRPKITGLYTSHAATLGYIVEDDGETLEEINEFFPGFVALAGFDMRFARDAMWVVDFNVGWRFPAIGNSGVDKRNDEIFDYLLNKGYLLDKEARGWKNFTISIGFCFVIGRNLEYVSGREK